MSGDYREPYYDTGQTAVYLGDVRDVLRSLPAESVNCVVTSPPYWSLRDYGIEPSVWETGQSFACTQIAEGHRWGDPVVMAGQSGGTNQGSKTDDPNGPTYRPSAPSSSQFCQRCNAWRGALGLEPTPALFVEHMVEVFQEVRRVLRPDGTAWVNLGDSYAGGGQGPTGVNGFGNHEERQGYHTPKRPPSGLKPKDLVGIPWRVAFALQDDGWWLRQDIIWAKPNPMPESVTDRCTKAHEYLFLLSKSATYYYDADAIREPNSDGPFWQAHPNGQANISRTDRLEGHTDGTAPNGWLKDLKPGGGRNKRSVWTVATAAFPKAHFATFPPDLVKPCILAGCPEGGTVLDPFFGSGTTGMVANSLGRKAIGIDLNPEYLEMARKRVSQLGMALTTEGDEA